MRKSIKVCATSIHYATWLDQHYNVEVQYEIEDADLLVLPGGADIDPSWYGHKQNRRTSCSKARDEREVTLFREAVKRGIPIVGICRGAQLSCALSGGLIIQDVSGHTRSHEMVITGSIGYRYPDGMRRMINSLHHQMMYPFNMDKKDYEILAFARGLVSDHHYMEEDVNIDYPKNFVEPEIIYFSNTKSLAIQGHPEMLGHNDPVMPYIFEQIDIMLG